MRNVSLKSERICLIKEKNFFGFFSEIFHRISIMIDREYLFREKRLEAGNEEFMLEKQLSCGTRRDLIRVLLFFCLVIVQREPLNFFLSKVRLITIEHESLCDPF